jgi:predicted nucleic acid-binding protein
MGGRLPEPRTPERPVKLLFDTNILIDYLNGVEAAMVEVERSRERCISIISWMELLAGAKDDAEEDVIDMFLREFRVVDLTRRIARDAMEIRRAHRIRLPDAMIWASAKAESALLVTRNTKDFPEGEIGIRVPYELTTASRPARTASARRTASR